MRLNSNLVSKKGRQLSSTKNPNPKEVGRPSLQGVATAAPFLPQGRAVTKETKLRPALLIPLPAPPRHRLVVVDCRRGELLFESTIIVGFSQGFHSWDLRQLSAFG